MDILFVTRWMPDARGGGTQQRAAANLRAVAACGRVHLLNLGQGGGPLPADMAPLVASVTQLADLKRQHPGPFRFESRQSLADRLLYTAWGMSGLIAQPSAAEALAIGRSLPLHMFDAVFAFHLGAACVADQLAVVRAGGRRVIDWDFLESPNVLPWARTQTPALGLAKAAGAHFNRLKVRHWESRILRRWDGHLCSSEQDTAFLRARCVTSAAVFAVNNSATVPQHCPAMPLDRPPTVVFVGTMAYWPNVDAMQHFLQQVWPAVRRALPQAELQVVGRAAPASLVARSGRDGVSVFADVPAVAPYYARSHIAVVPLRFSVGSNLKVPEAMALGRPVVGYRNACERHAVTQDAGVFAVDDAQRMAGVLVQLLQDLPQVARLGAAAHGVARDRFSSPVIERRLSLALKQIFSFNQEATSAASGVDGQA